MLRKDRSFLFVIKVVLNYTVKLELKYGVLFAQVVSTT